MGGTDPRETTEKAILFARNVILAPQRKEKNQRVPVALLRVIP